MYTYLFGTTNQMIRQVIFAIINLGVHGNAVYVHAEKKAKHV